MATNPPVPSPADWKPRNTIQPVLPELSRLFKAHAAKKLESTSREGQAIDSERKAVAEFESSASIIQSNAPVDISSDLVVEQEGLNHTSLVDDKAVSASTASQTGTPSVSTPATLELAAEVLGSPLNNDKEVVCPEVVADIAYKAEDASKELTPLGTDHQIESNTPTVLPPQESRLDSPYGHVAQSDATSAIVDDENQPPLSSSATSLAQDSDDRALGRASEVLSQVTQAGYPTVSALGQAEDTAPQQLEQRDAVEADPDHSFPITAVPRAQQLPSLNEYFLHVAASKEYADWLIQLHAPTSKAQSYPSYAHSIILLRSQRMRRLIARQSPYGTNIIDLHPPRYVLPHAFESALRFFYTDSVIAKDFFLHQPSSIDSHAVRLHHLDYILSYWISGIELGLETISERSETLLSDFLDWDLIEPAYKAAEEIARSEISSNSKHLTGTDYIAMSSLVLRAVMHFLVIRLDIINFRLDTYPNSSRFPPRISMNDGARQHTNPALASMVFGSMPSTAGASPIPARAGVSATTFKPRDTIASNVFLNLDFDGLQRFNNLLQRRGAAPASRIMTEIVKEREARRLMALNNPAVSNADRLAAPAEWEVVGWEEVFDNGTLSQQRVGFLLPYNEEGGPQGSK